MNASKAATLVGLGIAAGTAATPVLNAVQGSMHTQDWISLVLSIAIAIFGKKATF